MFRRRKLFPIAISCYPLWTWRAVQSEVDVGGQHVYTVAEIVDDCGRTAAAVHPRPVVSVSDIVGPVFEREARTALGACVRAACPWAREITAVHQRSVAQYGNGDDDVACYAIGDDCRPCVGQTEDGLEVVLLKGRGGRGGPLNFARPPQRDVLRAPGAEAKARGKRTGPRKYIIAEAYSGCNEAKVEEHVVQLESSLGVLLRRHNDEHDAAITDVTELVGAAVLLLSNPRGQWRNETLSARMATITFMIQSGQTGGPHLKRLALARRLLVMVVHASAAPQAHAQRLISLALAGKLDIVDNNE